MAIYEVWFSSSRYGPNGPFFLGCVRLFCSGRIRSEHSTCGMLSTWLLNGLRHFRRSHQDLGYATNLTTDGGDVRHAICFLQKSKRTCVFVVADAELTPLGISQAADAQSAWKKELAFDAPLPHKMYCSPLTRALRTHQITFQDVISSRKTLVVEV